MRRQSEAETAVSICIFHFIKAGAMALGVGADLVDPKALREGNSALLTERARQFLEIVQLTRAPCS